MTSDMPRIINFMGLPVDFVPMKDFVGSEYEDKPGQIGKIGTVFGDAGINVESMQMACRIPSIPWSRCSSTSTRPFPPTCAAICRRRSTSSASGTSTCRGLITGQAQGELHRESPCLFLVAVDNDIFGLTKVSH